jgi:hypothetical protein
MIYEGERDFKPEEDFFICNELGERALPVKKEININVTNKSFTPISINFAMFNSKLKEIGTKRLGVNRNDLLFWKLEPNCAFIKIEIKNNSFNNPGSASWKFELN